MKPYPQNQARVLFANWLKSTYPDLFSKAYEHAETWRKGEAARQGNPATISGLGQTATGETQPVSFWQRFTEGITNLATGVLAYKSQKDIIEANIARASQGLPPIDSTTGAPVLRTQVEITPEIAARLQATATEGMTKILMFGGIAVAAFLLLGRRRRA